jgi:hypothetical protein
MLDAFFSNLLETFCYRVIKRGANLYVKSAANEREAKRLARQFGKLNADPAQDAFAWLENYAAGLNLLLEVSPVRPEPSGFGPVNLGVMLQQAIA